MDWEGVQPNPTAAIQSAIMEYNDPFYAALQETIRKTFRESLKARARQTQETRADIIELFQKDIAIHDTTAKTARTTGRNGR